MYDNHPLGDVQTLKDKYNDENIAISFPKIPAFLNLFAKKGQRDLLHERFDIQTQSGSAIERQDFTIFPLAPDQWAIKSHHADPIIFADQIRAKVRDYGHVSDQSASRVCFRISGQKSREFLSRGCRLDLHPSVIGKGFVAQTIIADIGVLMHMVDETSVFDLYVYSGFARSFWHFVDQTAYQFKTV